MFRTSESNRFRGGPYYFFVVATILTFEIFRGYYFLIVIAICLLFVLLKRVSNNTVSKNIPADTSHTSLLLAMYSLGVSLQKITEGDLGNFHYSIFLTAPVNTPQLPATNTEDNDPSHYDEEANDPDSDAGLAEYYNEEANADAPMELPIDSIPVGTIKAPLNQIILSVDIPFNNIHVAGLSTKDESFRSLLGNTSIDNMMTKVELEGDFPDYFKLYCDGGEEIELREVLDPTSMAFLVDFCETMNWEIIDNLLYFTQSGNKSYDPNDKDSVLKAAQDFTTKILPTLQRMSQASSQATSNTQTTT